jgi:hypothetical protein
LLAVVHWLTRRAYGGRARTAFRSAHISPLSRSPRISTGRSWVSKFDSTNSSRLSTSFNPRRLASSAIQWVQPR